VLFVLEDVAVPHVFMAAELYAKVGDGMKG
jgi:hypothetical protein